MDVLRHLRYFVAVAEELHFGRAAERLQIAQPPLSQRIRALERHLDLQLFNRTTRRVELTPAGRLLLDEARTVIAGVERLESVMAGARDGGEGVLRLGVSTDLPSTLMAALADRAAERYPEVRFTPVEQAAAEQVAALTDRRIDLAVVRAPESTSAIETGARMARPLGALLDASDPIAGHGAVELERLDHPVLVPPRGAERALRDSVLATCSAYGFTPVEVVSAESLDFAAGLVLTRRAVALTEEPAVAPAGTVWRPLADEPLSVVAAVGWRRGDSRGTVRTLAGLLREVLIEQGGWRSQAAPVPYGPSRPRPADGMLA